MNAKKPMPAFLMKKGAAKKPEMPGMACGGKVKKYAAGGFVRAADGIASKGKTKGKMC